MIHSLSGRRVYHVGIPLIHGLSGQRVFRADGLVHDNLCLSGLLGDIRSVHKCLSGRGRVYQRSGNEILLREPMPLVVQTGGLISTIVLISIELQVRVEIREVELR